MVVFTCQKCNTTLKKNAVEKHFRCRPFFLTCIDCLKDFRGKEYEEHKTCISEAQKYGGANFVAKAQGVKQEQWMELVAKVLTNISSNNRYKNICKGIMSSANIPRHRVKFNNYIKCAHPRLYDEALVNEIFDHLEAEKDSSKNRASGNTTTCTIKTTQEECNTTCSLEKSVARKEAVPKEIKDISQNLAIGNDNNGSEKNTKEDNSSMEANGKNIKWSDSNEKSSNIDSYKKNKKKNKEKNNISYQFTDAVMEGEEPVELNKSLQLDESLQKKKKKKKNKSYNSTLEFLEGEVLPDETEKEATDQDKSFNLGDNLQKKKMNCQPNSPTKGEYRQIEAEDKTSSSPLEKGNVNKEVNKNIIPITFRSKMKQESISKKKILASLSHDQKTKIDCWFNIQKQSDADKQNKNIDPPIQILPEEQNSFLVNENKNNNDSNKLSRKQEKLLKKQKKYAAEINEIENFKPEELNENDDVKSKSKNRETYVTESNFLNSSKRKHEDENRGDDPEKKMKVSLNETLQIEEIQTGPGKKFKWGNVIKEVLQSNSDKDLSLKKLRKKVMNEYRRQKGDDVPYDKLLGIFNKKLNKTVGVKVLKDKVTLVDNDDNS